MDSRNDTVDTERLLDKASLGDRSAINELTGKYRDYLRRVIDLRLDRALRTRVDTSDIIQETLVVATKRLDDFIIRRPTSFKLWLRGEAMQQIGMQHRKHRTAARRSVQRECSMSEASGVLIAENLLNETPSKIAQRNELALKVRGIVEELPDTDREILLLRYIEDLSNAEAAELLQIDPATARKRHGRALKRMLAAMTSAGIVAEGEQPPE